MPFIGNQPALSYTSFAKQDFTTSATTSYTLDNPVANANELALFINFVRQEPTTAYTASGTTLTLTSATSATDDMYCVFLGKAVQTVTPASGSVTGDMLSKPFNYDSGTLYLDDTNNRVGIGTASPSVKLQVNGGVQIDETNLSLDIKGNSILCADGKVAGFGGDYVNAIYKGTGTEALVFRSNNSERMRIDNSGNVFIGKTSSNGAIVGCELLPNGTGLFTRDSNIPLYINRNTTDGVLVSLRQGNVQEGTIQVSGSTVSFVGFTGTHWSRFIDNSTPNILRGTVLESLDEMCDWYNLEFDVTTTTQDEDGNDVTNTVTEKVPHVLADGQSVGDVITYNHEETDVQATIVKEGDVKHMMSKVSDNSDAKNVYGVFIDYDNDGEGYNDFYVASVGSFVVRIKANETIAKGDLLQSNGDGTAKVQIDDNIKSSSFAKVLSTTVIKTYEDGSYLVPCSLMC
jgi:hypothetical protein